jgi:hypothetical protein
MGSSEASDNPDGIAKAVTSILRGYTLQQVGLTGNQRGKLPPGGPVHPGIESMHPTHPSSW